MRLTTQQVHCWLMDHAGDPEANRFYHHPLQLAIHNLGVTGRLLGWGTQPVQLGWTIVPVICWLLRLFFGLF